MAQARCFAISLFSIGLGACADLPHVAPGICGNGVVERDAANAEECDGWAQSGARCRPPGSAVGACRFDCAIPIDPKTGLQSGTAPSCPDDMSCGLDGICRAATGQYEVWGDTLPLRAHSLRLGDLDGDGAADLLTLDAPTGDWQAKPLFVFFDSEGKRKRVLDLQTIVTSPDWLELPRLTPSRPPKHAAVVGTMYGIATLSADPAQEIFSTPYPFQILPPAVSYRMARIGGTNATSDQEQVLLFISGQDTGVLLTADTNERVGTVPKSVDALAGELTTGNIDQTPCDEVVLAFHDDSNVYAHGVCSLAGDLRETDDGPHIVAALPLGHSVASSPILARIDSDDANLDLLVSDEANHPYLAFGLGDGTFAADRVNSSSTSTPLWPVVVQCPCCERSTQFADRFPLAVGDLNHDGESDWVFPNGIALRRGVDIDTTNQRVVVSVCAGNAPSGKEWSIAQIVDLNRDGSEDLVAGSALVSGLDVFIGTDKNRMNPVPIQTDGPVRHLFAGDYDGDRTKDIAFVQDLASGSTGPTDSAPTAGLAIAFGSAYGFPSAPVNIAEFPVVDQILAAHYLSNDDVDAIGILSSDPNHTNSQLSLFFGNPGRHPISPLGLWRNNVDEDGFFNQPLASAVGRFHANGTQSIIALGVEDASGEGAFRYRLWLAENNAAGQLSSLTASKPLRPDAEAVYSPSYQLAANFVVGRLDLDGLDDALLLTSGNSGAEVMLWRIAVPFPSDTDALTYLSSAPGRLTASSSPILIDLDGDSRSDLVFMLSVNGKEALYLVWNSPGPGLAAGMLDLSQAMELPVPLARAAAPYRSTTKQTLFVASDSGIYEISANAKRELASSRLTFANAVDAPILGGDAIAVGDMTGDGIADLAVSHAGRVLLYKQKPRLP